MLLARNTNSLYRSLISSSPVLYHHPSLNRPLYVFFFFLIYFLMFASSFFPSIFPRPGTFVRTDGHITVGPFCFCFRPPPPSLTFSPKISTKDAYRPLLCSVHFNCISLSTKIMSVSPLLDPNLRWFSCVFSCAIAWMNVSSETRSKILPPMESNVKPR